MILVHFSIHKPSEYIQKTAVHVHALEVAVRKGTMMHDAPAAAAVVVVVVVVQVQFCGPWFSFLIGVRLRLRPCWFCCTFCHWDWTCMLGNPLPVWLWLYDVLYLNLHLLKLPRGLKCLYIYIFQISLIVDKEREANLNVWLHLVATYCSSQLNLNPKKDVN